MGSCPKSKLSAVCLSSALAAGNLPVDQLATPDRTQDCLEKHYLLDVQIVELANQEADVDE